MTEVEASATPSWTDLAQLARSALTRVVTIEAAVRFVMPGSAERDAPSVEQHRFIRFARPDRWRVDDETGPLVVRGFARHVRREAGQMRELEYAPVWWPDIGAQAAPDCALGGLGWGYPGLFLSPPAMSNADEGPYAVTVAGRPAWEVLIHASARKPWDLRFAIDAESGLPLRARTGEGDGIAEVTDLTLDRLLSDEVFEWTPDVLPDDRPEALRRQDQQARMEVSANRARAARWPVTDEPRPDFTMGFWQPGPTP